MERFQNRRDALKWIGSATALAFGIGSTKSELTRAAQITTPSEEQITLFEKVDTHTLAKESPNFTPVTESYAAPVDQSLITPAEFGNASRTDQLLMNITMSEMTPPDHGNKLVIHGLQVMCIGDEYTILGCDVQRSRVEFNPDMPIIPQSI